MMPRTADQIYTMRVLDMVFEERQRQNAKHGDAMLHLPDGVGVNSKWLEPLSVYGAAQIEVAFRLDYQRHRGSEHDGPLGSLTRMHLVREELAEMFECDPDSPEFIEEALQVAALCVQWVEYKLP